MTTITLEDIKAQQAKIAEMLSAIHCQDKRFFALEAGEQYAGVILGKDGEKSYRLILLPGEGEKLTWKQAKEWAAQAGGELPTRREQTLLFANLKEAFQPEWYWSGEAYASDSDYAWCQGFDNGYQDYSTTHDRLRARAVRRLVIE